MNPYKILGVCPGSDTVTVKKAYLYLARKLHPDKTQGTTTEAFQKIQYAYEILQTRHITPKYYRVPKSRFRVRRRERI